MKEIAEELNWKAARVYKQLKIAAKGGLVKYEEGTREKNLKRVLPIGRGLSRFLPSPRMILKQNRELGNKVKYVDPLSGKWKAVRR